jgi:chondroitin 4-sulfotransferase 11
MGVWAYRLNDLQARLHTRYVADVSFVHINKTGGSSIEKALQLPFQHRTALELRALIGERRWSRRFSFAFVRNPWDKVASHYHYRVKTNQTGLKVRPVPFSEWVNLTYGLQALPYYDQPKMFMPQVDWISDGSGRTIVDFVGRFENLANDFAVVCGKIGRSATLPHEKRSASGDYRRHYDDQTAETVGKWFEKDIAAFGYSFDGRTATKLNMETSSR